MLWCWSGFPANKWECRFANQVYLSCNMKGLAVDFWYNDFPQHAMFGFLALNQGEKKVEEQFEQQLTKIKKEN